ncbi:MAG: hypothetical protein C0483_19100 [Pirellula sp.]|nr:hypothetical protein [Pirellula sp.]
MISPSTRRLYLTLSPAVWSLSFLAATAAAAEPASLHVPDAVVTLSEQIEVPARSAGVLATMNVREGDVVKAGQVAGVMDDADARLAVAKAETEAAIARAEADNKLKALAAEKAAAAAKAELQRALESGEKYAKSVSQSELDRLRLQADKGSLEHQQAEHERSQAQLTARIKANELDAARRKLELHRITAPASGMVVDVRKHVGEWVEPGMPVLRIVRMDPLRVEAFVSAADAVGLRPGCDASFQIAAGGATDRVAGKLSFISPEIDPINGQVRIWVDLPNADGTLRPGLQGTLVITPAGKLAPVDGAR